MHEGNRSLYMTTKKKLYDMCYNGITTARERRHLTQ